MKYLATVPLVSLLLAAAPAYAQYYPSYPTAGVASCITLTAYQALGSSDATTGGQVSLMQQFMNRTGYLTGVSGYFDNGTYGAVVNYQAAHGIQTTGTVGPQTRAAINAQSCNGISTSYGSSIPVIQYPYNSYGNSYGNYNGGYGNYYYGAPSISSLSSTVGQSGQQVTIYGRFSGTNDTVHFGNQTVAAVLNSNTSLTFTVPAFSTGNYSVYVSNAFGSSNSLSFTVTGYNNCNSYPYSYNNGYNNCDCTNSYNYNYNYSYSSTNSYYNNYNNCNSNNGGYNAQPYVSSISGPSSVSAGSTNSWTVTSYAQSGNALNVKIDWGDGSQYQNLQYGSGSHQYTFSHQYSSQGSYSIRITATDASTGAYAYATRTVNVSGYNYCNGNSCGGGDYYGQPYISSLSRTSASAGSTITIYGSNFNGNTIVYFGNSAYTPSSMSDSVISVQVPYMSFGSYPVSVRNGNGATSNSVYFSIY
jgi:hypothetical protein